MIFSSKAQPQRSARWLLALASLAAAAATVVGCGGATTQFDPFAPQRLFAFGDEASTITDSGRNYSVNGLKTDGAFDCTLLPIWTQQVANVYGFVFAQCNPAAVATPAARSYAAAGAKVADVGVQVQVAASQAQGGFNDKDLALMLAGANDIYELYAQYPARSASDLINDAGARGAHMAAIVNATINLGAKVVVANLPDLGMTPFALAEQAAHTDTDRAALITALATAFNDQLGVKILLDGRFVGLVQLDLRTQQLKIQPGSMNITNAVCAVALPDCTTATLTPADASPAGYLWADAKWPAPGGHNVMAGAALERARGNPF